MPNSGSFGAAMDRRAACRRVTGTAYATPPAESAESDAAAASVAAIAETAVESEGMITTALAPGVSIVRSTRNPRAAASFAAAAGSVPGVRPSVISGAMVTARAATRATPGG